MTTKQLFPLITIYSLCITILHDATDRRYSPDFDLIEIVPCYHYPVNKKYCIFVNSKIICASYTIGVSVSGISKIKMVSFGLATWLIIAGVGCEKGLESVTGFEGKISLPVDSSTGKVMWPDSLTGAVVIVAEFQFPLYTSLDSLFVHIVTYSDPLDTSQAVQNYFLQTPPGVYLGGVVALKAPIMEIMFAPLDSLKAHSEYFQPVALYKPGGSTQVAGTIGVSEDEIVSGIDMQVDFNFVLPF